MEEEVIQPESTQQDYWNTLNPGGIPYTNPELRFNAAEDNYGGIDYESQEFKSVFDTQDGATKVQMLKANNNNDALKIAARRDIFKESQKAIENDGMFTQLGMGVLPAIASPSSLIPFGAVFKGAQLANATSRLMKGVQVGAAGATTGAAANLIDEAIFDIQGMPTNYLGAGAVGAIFGGSLGFLGGILSGPNSKSIANAITPENDTYTRDFQKDPALIMLDENGVPKLQDVGKMEKSLLDKVPFIGKYLRSDVHTVLQSESPMLRSLMLRMSTATTSLTDSLGNIMPVNKTGVDFKRETKGIHNILTQELTGAHTEAVSLGYKGDLDQFNKDTWGVYVTAMNEQKNAAAKYSSEMGVDVKATNKAARDAELKEVRGRNPGKKTKKVIAEEDLLVAEIKARYADELSIEMKRLEDEFFEANPWEFKGDVSTTKAANSYRKYFQDMLKRSQDVGIKELQGMNINRLYAPRAYNYKGIKAGTVSQEVVRVEVRNGLLNDYRNSGLSGDSLEEAVDGIVNMLNKGVFNTNFLSTSFLVKDLPFKTHLQQKKLYLNEKFMPNILKDDLGELAGAYHYQMSGRQATQYSFGTDKLEDIGKLIEEEQVNAPIKATADEIQAFDRTVKDLIGELRMNQLADTPSWTFTRQLTSFNSARLGGGFGGNQFIELASAVAMNGVKAVMSGRIFKSLKNSSDLLYTKSGKHDDFAQYLIGSGYMEDTLHTSRINRYADTEQGFNSGWIENKLNWMNDKLMKYNGMRYFMGVMEDYTGSAIVTQLKAGKITAKRLARWGLSKEDADNLGKQLNKHTSDDGWDLGALTAVERDQLQLAISRGIDEIVVQGDSIHLPAWMKAPGQFTKVLTQFMRFPLIAQEVLTRKGMAEEQAQMAAGTLSSIVAFMGLKYLREQAAIATGTIHEIDSKYNYDSYTDDDYIRVIGEALNYTAPLGFMTSVYNYGAIATGNNELGREWSSKNGMSSLLGPSGGLGEDIIQIMRKAYEGDITDERTLNRVKSMTPFMNLPLLNEGGKYLIEEYGD